MNEFDNVSNHHVALNVALHENSTISLTQAEEIILECAEAGRDFNDNHNDHDLAQDKSWQDQKLQDLLYQRRKYADAAQWKLLS